MRQIGPEQECESGWEGHKLTVEMRKGRLNVMTFCQIIARYIKIATISTPSVTFCNFCVCLRQESVVPYHWSKIADSAYKESLGQFRRTKTKRKIKTT